MSRISQSVWFLLRSGMMGPSKQRMNQSVAIVRVGRGCRSISNANGAGPRAARRSVSRCMSLRSDLRRTATVLNSIIDRVDTSHDTSTPRDDRERRAESAT